ncbi:MAG: cytochrome c-type biogenesis protein CcmH [Acidimicrobiia bacterium]
MKRVATWAAIAAVTAAALVLGLQPAGGSRSTQAQADRIASELRCPVCQGLSVRDSDSPTARAMREDIGRRLSGGETPEEIRRAYVDRYGEWILLRPSASGLGTLLWVVPAAALAAAAVVLGWVFWGWRRRSGARAPSNDDRVLVAMALRDIRGNGDLSP